MCGKPFVRYQYPDLVQFKWTVQYTGSLPHPDPVYYSGRPQPHPDPDTDSHSPRYYRHPDTHPDRGPSRTMDQAEKFLFYIKRFTEQLHSCLS
jgi:hypothetical protein